MQEGSEAPTPNTGPNESFDVLIDLLASDDVVQDPRFVNNFGDGLRDADGKLDFEKIHTFFSGGHDNDDHPALRDNLARQSETRPSPDNDDEVGESFVGLSPPAAPSNSATNPSGIPSAVSIISRSKISTSKKDASDISHDGTTALHGPPSPQYIAANKRHDNSSQRHVEHEPIQISPFIPQDSEPIKVQALTKALELANAEVASLRQQCDELRFLTQGHRDTGGRALNSPVLRPVYDHSSDSSISGLGLEGPASSNAILIDLPTEIVKLSGDEARQMLASFLRHLSLPPSCVLEETIHEPTFSTEHRPTNIGDIQRALEFVLSTDELIWRRSVYSPTRGGPTAAVFQDQNMTALSERVKLWERIVRGPHS